MERSAGILLPVFSLPGPYGIGSLGREARAFAEFLHNAGQRWWQVLPVGPTGAGNSPYTSESTFAGNPLLIDLEDLRDRGLLTEAELSAARVPEGAPIDYAALYESREALLRRAFSRLGGAEAQSVRDFAAANPWLGEYALYRALKARFGQTAWFDWPDKDLLNRDPAALAAARQELAEDIAFHQAVQFWFFSQWKALKDHANGLGVRIIGDLPIYVSLDSADVWSERREFLLDETGRPSRVAGVPPDYFSEEGQLWGNPLYDWAAQKRDGFGWWIRRIDGAGKLYDVIRIDHFRGFESYWAVPYGEATAKNGRWVKGPGMALVGVLTGWFPQLEFIAEDLGYPTPEVAQLLRDSGLPGMKVLEFAFDSRDTSSYLPHSYGENCICYTGTHDNSPLALWRQEADPADIAFAKEYLGLNDEEGFNRGIIRGGMSSVAKLFVAQMQDYLELGAGHRTNEPGTQSGNWQWRMLPGELTPELAQRIRKLTRIYGRLA